MKNLPSVTPPVFSSDEDYQAWLKGDTSKLKQAENIETNPPVFESDEDYEKYLRGEGKTKNN